ncbi:hypothetical protein CPLU01_05891 [Colletotrichum plurivorum]|uniref:Uncharacterized protein n=1 Tax=Colletotrichum plurivorum TaxID=2175906 RepID=A0A8H6KK04_9PEZI|nr:hypothetical protein CPLU01_05891 [Colletotrichum plurivorum]
MSRYGGKNTNHGCQSHPSRPPSAPASPIFPLRLDCAASFHADLNAALSDATRRDPDSPVYFRVSPSNLPQLETFMADVDVSRVSYDSVTELACLEMTETALHSVVGFDISVMLLAAKDRLRGQIRAAIQARGGVQPEPASEPGPNDDDKAAVVHHLTKVRSMGTTTINVPGTSDNKQPDFSFRELGSPRYLPSFCGEVLYSQRLESAESKCCLYSKAGIHFVLLIDIQYPDADQATVSVHFLGGSRGVPEEFRRPRDQDHAESAAQASELGRVSVTFEQLRDILENAKETHEDQLRARARNPTGENHLSA